MNLLSTGSRNFVLALSMLLAAGSTVSALAAPASQPGNDWPKWRGPNGDNIPPITAFPADLGKGLKKLWAVNDLCRGKNSGAWSCPVISGDRLVVTGRDEANDTVVCLNSDTGEKVWSTQIESPAVKDVQYGNGPRATPIIDGDRVYTFGCMGLLVCQSLADGKEIWKVNVKDLGGQQPIWGFSSSPLIVGDRIVVQIGGKSAAVALNKKTGAKVWASVPGPTGYAAITPAKLAGQEVLLAFTGNSLLGLNGETGEKKWEVGWPTAMSMNCATPIQLSADTVLLTSTEHGKSGGMALVKVGPDGAKTVWENHELGPAHNDPVVIDNHAYAYTGFSLNPKGFCCVDLATGKQTWYSDQLGGPGTVIRVGDNLLCLNNRGKLLLVKPSVEGATKLSEFAPFTGDVNPVWTQPVIARGKLYVRFANQLVCYEIGQ